MIRAKKVRLEPNKEQEKAFWRFTSANRVVWNMCKAKYEEAFQKDGTYLSLSDLRKYIKELKTNDPNFAWLQEVPVAVTSQAILDLLNAYKRFYAQRKKSGYDPQNPNKFKPKFKSRDKTTPSFYQRTDVIRKTDNTHIKITGIKTPVKCRALRDIDLPKRILDPRITYDGKYWFLSYSYEVEIFHEVPKYDRENLGIDLGVKEFAILSNGDHYPNINKDKKIRKLRKRLKRLQRQVSRKYEANATYDSQGNKIYKKTNNIKKLEKKIQLIYRRIHNIQKNYMYLVTKAIMETKPKSITIENLNVKGMLQNPKMARMVQEQNFFTFKLILIYKCEMANIELRLADRWYPSSKKCHCCGHIKKNLRLSDRTYHCENCGLKIDRDENAAINLENCEKFERLTHHLLS